VGLPLNPWGMWKIGIVRFHLNIIKGYQGLEIGQRTTSFHEILSKFEPELEQAPRSFSDDLQEPLLIQIFLFLLLLLYLLI